MERTSAVGALLDIPSEEAPKPCMTLRLPRGFSAVHDE